MVSNLVSNWLGGRVPWGVLYISLSRDWDFRTVKGLWMRLDCFYRAECGGYMHPAYCTPYLGTFSPQVGHHWSWVLNSLVGLHSASKGLFLSQ